MQQLMPRCVCTLHFTFSSADMANGRSSAAGGCCGSAAAVASTLLVVGSHSTVFDVIPQPAAAATAIAAAAAAASPFVECLPAAWSSAPYWAEVLWLAAVHNAAASCCLHDARQVLHQCHAQAQLAAACIHAQTGAVPHMKQKSLLVDVSLHAPCTVRLAAFASSIAARTKMRRWRMQASVLRAARNPEHDDMSITAPIVGLQVHLWTRAGRMGCQRSHDGKSVRNIVHFIPRNTVTAFRNSRLRSPSSSSISGPVNEELGKAWRWARSASTAPGEARLRHSAETRAPAPYADVLKFKFTCSCDRASC